MKNGVFIAYDNAVLSGNMQIKWVQHFVEVIEESSRCVVYEIEWSSCG